MKTMDFFARQREAQRATKWLVLGFGTAVVCILGAVYGLVTWTIVTSDPAASWFQPQVLAWTVLLVGGTIATASLVRTAMLRAGGGPRVAQLLGGREVTPDTDSRTERQLRNVVEEMSIASGVPVPRVFVLDDEPAVNAFAAGWGTADAVVAVTRGALEQLNRDELQGVVAHEFSHVFHGDMRLNMRLMGVLFGIVCIATAGRILLHIGSNMARVRSSGSKGSSPAVALFAGGLALLVVGSLGVFLARILQAAISRQREYLADAAAVQYTRNPHGIGMALARIGGLGSALAAPRTPEARHMLFAEGVRGFLSGLHASHPPVRERIERILPGFLRNLRGTDLEAAVAATPAPVAATTPLASGLAPTGPRGVTPEDLVATTGTLGRANMAAARELLGALPRELVEALHTPASARCIVLALLVQHDAAAREVQLQHLAAQGEPAGRVSELASLVDSLDGALRLPLLELALPALRTLPAPERASLRTHARALAQHDGTVSVAEFVLLQLVTRHTPTESPRAAPLRQRPLRAMLPQAALCLGCIAWHGAEDEASAGHAFAHGAAALDATLALPARAAATVDTLEVALADLDRLGSTDKRRMLLACGRAAAADGMLGTQEVELVRGLAARWDCPIPPSLHA
ncbi:MAG: hypothetical protein RL148_2959 [Planctomycetota bacterium]